MRFAAPTYFWLMLPWVLAPLVWYVLERSSNRKFERFLSAEMRERLVASVAVGKRRLKFVLLWLAAGFAIVALARPQMGAREEEVKSQGLDVVFLLDVSNSMTTEDIVPSRLKKAKHIIKGFVERFSGDRAGLVAFAGSSFPAIPLTTDYEYIKQTLETLNENSISNQGTNLFSALDNAIKLLERGGLNEKQGDEQSEDHGDRAIILISDGEDHEGAEAALVTKLKERGIRVYAIGVGSLKGGPMPMRDDRGNLTGYKRDASGSPAISKLQTAALESISSKTRGKYFNATMEEGEIDQIMSELSTLERSEGGGRRVMVYEEIYQYPLALAVVLLIIMMVITDRKRVRASVATSFVVAVLAGAFGGASVVHAAESVGEYRESKKGIDAYKDEDLANSVNHFGRAQAENPESKLNNYNLGTALLKSGSVELAVPELQEGTKNQDLLSASKSAYNLGRALEQQKQPDKALQAYQDALSKLKELKSQNKFDKNAEEVARRTKQALERTEEAKQQSQNQGQGQGQQGQQGQDGNQNKNQDQQGQQDKKDQQGQNQDKRYNIPKEKQKFKAEQLSEQDAKRLLQQLKEQENQTLQRMRRQKANKKEDRKLQDEKSDKDW